MPEENPTPELPPARVVSVQRFDPSASGRHMVTWEQVAQSAAIVKEADENSVFLNPNEDTE